MKSGKRIRTTLCALAALVLLATGCGLLGPKPVARVEVRPETGQVPFQAIIDSSASGPGDSIVRELSVDGGPFQVVDELHGLTVTTIGDVDITLRVTNGYGRSATANATITGMPGPATESGFTVDVIYPGDRAEPAARGAFEAAAAMWSRVIVGDLADAYVDASQVEQACGANYRFSGAIDDLLLLADVRTIDGPGQVVGMAGSCLLRADGFPLVGLVVIDRDDIDYLIQSGRLATVVLHEVGHVLELSHSAWSSRDLLEFDGNSCLDSRDIRFLGSNAQREYNRLGGSGHVPVEANGVPGTACSHWSEAELGSELMTGYLDMDARLSAVTAGALADIGYQVDYEATDPYSLPPSGTFTLNSTHEEVREQLISPGGVIHPDGTFEPLDPRPDRQLQLRLPLIVEDD